MLENCSRLKKRVFDVIQIGNRSDHLSRAFDIFIVITILVNISVMFLETFSGMSKYNDIFEALELITMIIFSIEYALRIWTANFLFPEERRGVAVFRFLISFDGIVDLFTILPFFFLSGFVAFRMLRVVRIFNLFRINPNTDSFNVITSVLYEKKNQIFSSIFIILVLMLASSLCMYSAENPAQPENFRNAFDGIWWSMSTLLTIGYGDVYPVTFLGKAMAMCIAFLGVGVVAIPTGIISAGFVEQYTKAQSSADALDISLQTVIVDIDSKWIGLGIKEISENYGVHIVLAKRGDVLIQPNDSYRVEMRDALAVWEGRVDKK
ncbi:MAG: ion transporter [Lachnospiraceae bacterium]|nr:ion transporter [Lachnospiraceae bacterium]